MTRKKIITRIFGGLGNQLFCFAAARRLALANDLELVIDNVTGFERDFRYKRTYQLDHFNIACRKATPAERLEPMSRARRYLARRFNHRRPFENRTYIKQEGEIFEPKLLSFAPKKTVHLEGYWQSENYFKDFETVIRAELEIAPPTDQTNLMMRDSILKSNSVAVHVRFFDEPAGSAAGGNNTPQEYYRRAVNIINERSSGAHFYIFSDKPEAARSLIKAGNESVTLVSHNFGDNNAYADLWLMSQCNHFIIANSTFSWWGSWLSRNDSKIVVAPGFVKLDGVSSWGFDGLLPESWEKV